MYIGLVASLLLHVGLIGWAVVSFASAEPPKAPGPEPVEVAIISPDDLVRLKKGDRASKNLKTRRAQDQETPKNKPKRKTARRAPPPPAAAAPPPPKADPPPKAKQPAPPKQSDPIADKLAALTKPTAPDPEAIALRKAQEAKKKAEAAAEAKRRAEAEAKRKAEEARKKAEAAAKRKAEARKKAEAERRKAEAERKKREAERKKRELARKRAAEKRRREAEARKKKEFDPGKIAALLNKVPDGAAKAGGSGDPNDAALPTGAEAGAPEGRDDRLTASQIAMIGVMMRSSVKRCWNINSGLEGAEDLAVEVEIRLKPDGQLDGEPVITNMRRSAVFVDAANSALRALKLCAPYDLPQNLYKGGWDHMVVRFDPRRMF